jgi:hypothetical protein
MHVRACMRKTWHAFAGSPQRLLKALAQACSTATASMAQRARRAGIVPASGPVQEHQQPASEQVTGLMDLPGHLLCLIWKQLGVADRKSLCCTARALRACEGGCLLHYELHLVVCSQAACRYNAHAPLLQRSMRC